MDIIHLTEENVVISNEPYIGLADQDEDDIRPIDMKSQKEVREELDRLRKLGGTYPNKDNIPSPAHIIRTEYDDVKDYRAAKDKYFKTIRDKIIKLSGNLKKLHDLNTELCREAKKKDDEEAIKNGTFYTPDDLEYLKIMNEKKKHRAEQINNASKKYYANNKDDIRAANKRKRAEEKLDGVETNEFNKHLIKMSEIIKPLCLCGKKCEVITQKDLIKHSKLTKHQLFKSVIRLIHYERRNRKLKSVVNKINKQLKDYKRVVRNKCERTRKSFTVTNKTEKETIIYYNDLVEPIDENLLPPVRESYIEEKDDTTTRSYKNKLLRRQWFVHPMKT